jgi:hypothetical protein
MIGTTRHDHKHLCTPDSRYSSTEGCVIIISHINSTTKICIIAMITLMRDKHALVKVHFSISVMVHQKPGRSTPHQASRPGGFAPPIEKVN